MRHYCYEEGRARNVSLGSGKEEYLFLEVVDETDPGVRGTESATIQLITTASRRNHRSGLCVDGSVVASVLEVDLGGQAGAELGDLGRRWLLTVVRFVALLALSAPTPPAHGMSMPQSKGTG